MKPQTSGLVVGKLKRKVLREPVGVAPNGKIQGFGGNAVEFGQVCTQAASGSLDCRVCRSEDFASSLFRLMDRRVAGPTGEPNSVPPKAVRIGANDARHREHLMAPARQLTSSASLKGNGCREIRLLEVRRLVARVTLRFESGN